MPLDQRSLTNLAQCDPRLAEIARLASQHADFTVICGHRDNAAQQIAYDEGKSKLPPGKSKHNLTPSKAFDFIYAPFPIGGEAWGDIPKFKTVASALIAAAHVLDIPVRWGGTWTDNPNDPPAHLFDADHFEIDEVSK
jgi:hypothetical protein